MPNPERKNSQDPPLPVLQGIPQTKEGLIDEGFCLLYYRLSYRRRFLRDLKLTPLCFIIFVLPQIPGFYLTPASRFGTFLFLLMVSGVSAIYNFRKWKPNEA